MLRAVQRGIERLYRLGFAPDVRAYVIDGEARDVVVSGRRAREQLLIRQEGDSLEVALFVDDAALRNLAANDPRRALDDGNFSDFLLLVEGVSHFVYLLWCARNQRRVSALELELQAEVDKYITCALTRLAHGHTPDDVRERLFQRFSYAPDLDEEERERYRTANENARSYTASLYQRFLKKRQVSEMLAELRRFYRLGAQEKLAHIARAA